MSRLERRVRAKLDRTIRHPRVHRNEQFLRRQENTGDSLAITDPEMRAFVARHGMALFKEAADIIDKLNHTTNVQMLCASCKRTTHLFVSVTDSDGRTFSLPDECKLCLHCPCCEEPLYSEMF